MSDGNGVKVKDCPICGFQDAELDRWVGEYSLMRCLSCSFVYANVIDKEVLDFNSSWDDTYTKMYDERQTGVDDSWFNRVATKVARLTINSGGQLKVLDVGCGNGLLLSKFKEKGWKCFGLDPSEWTRKASREQGFIWLNGYAEQMVKLFPDFFDAITSTSTLEHIPRPREHVTAVCKMLKVGGVAYFSGIPNYGSITVRAGISDFYNNRPPMHCNYFTPETVKHLFTIGGELQVRTYGVSNMFYRMLPKTALKRGKTKSGGLLSSVYYNIGSPFNLGDKIEITFRRT